MNRELIKRISTYSILAGGVGFVGTILASLFLHWYGLTPGLIASGSMWLVVLGALVRGLAE